MRDLGLDPCQQKPRSLWVRACFHCQVEGRGGEARRGGGRVEVERSVVEGGFLLQSKVRAVVVVVEPMISFSLLPTVETLSVFAETGLEPWGSFCIFYFFIFYFFLSCICVPARFTQSRSLAEACERNFTSHRNDNFNVHKERAACVVW